MKHSEAWLVAFGLLVLVLTVALRLDRLHLQPTAAPVDAGEVDDGTDGETGGFGCEVEEPIVSALPGPNAHCGPIVAWTDGGVVTLEREGTCKPCLLGCAYIAGGLAARPYDAVTSYHACAEACRVRGASDMWWGDGTEL